MNDIVYVGSSAAGLAKLENNHRNAHQIEGYTVTKFRANKWLQEGQGCFEWLVSPAMRTELEVLQLEKALIQKWLPRYNEQYDPITIKKNKFDMTVKYRGVYGVTL
jgi:hypothetical protein|tara:strand:- start:27 stop:344 length:318 start_codon:yes stop_codon:yes gene_type:complete